MLVDIEDVPMEVDPPAMPEDPKVPEEEPTPPRMYAIQCTIETSMSVPET